MLRRGLMLWGGRRGTSFGRPLRTELGQVRYAESAELAGDDSLQLVAGLHEPTLDRDGRRPPRSRRSRLTLVAEGDDRVKAFTDARHERAQVRDRCGVDVDADQRLVAITHQRDVGGGADRGPEGEDA